MQTTTNAALTWERVGEVPALGGDEVHLWWQDLHSPRLDGALRPAALLSEREQQRAARFRVDRARREYTAARGVLRALLSRYLDQPPDAVALHYGPLGKPGIPAGADGPGLGFNYTDAGGFALYAFARDRELGVDLEQLSRRVACRRIIERRFAPREAAALLALPEETRRRRFLACWTRKEGYGKALGVGIHYPLDCRELCEDCDASPLAVTDHINGDAWDIHQLYPDADFVGALVHPRGALQQRCLRLAETL